MPTAVHETELFPHRVIATLIRNVKWEMHIALDIIDIIREHEELAAGNLLAYCLHGRNKILFVANVVACFMLWRKKISTPYGNAYRLTALYITHELLIMWENVI